MIERGLSEASASTIWRWLHDDALKPWQQRSWVFARDPAFAEKAGRVLDLYQRRFEGRRLRPDEYVICADEKSQLQALGRTHPTLPPAPGRASRFEFEYERHGTVAYLAGWDVHQASLFDRVEAKTGIEPFGRLVEQVMTVEPYCLRAHRLLDRRQRQLTRRPGEHRPASRRLRQPAPDPPTDPRLLAQPDRALLLDRPTQGAHAQRLRLNRRAHRASPALRRLLPPDREAVRLDLHPRQPRPPARPNRGAPAPTPARGVTELTDACTRRRLPVSRPRARRSR